jgi:seryl-tRNA synthetase
MLDLAFVRANLPLVEEKLRLRGTDPALLSGFAALDTDRRSAITELEALQAQRNTLSADFGRLKREGGDTSAISAQTDSLKARSAELEATAAAADLKLRDLLASLPNLPQDSVPPGTSEHDNVCVKTWGNIPTFPFTPKPHWELGEALGILDFERAAKVSGARFVLHFGAGARLERALANFMLDLHTRHHGYVEVLPPFMVNSRSLFGTGQLPKFEGDLFYCVDKPALTIDEGRKQKENWWVGGANEAVDEIEAAIRQSDHWLIPTAEVPVTNIFRDEVIDLSSGPISFTAYTPCFRSEAGSHGKDTRGMIRQHQFQKVELVKFCAPEDSEAQHELLTGHAEAVLEALGLPYRRMLLCSGDMGFSSSKTYDLEVWVPGQNTFREISSCSNFQSFQARRANIKYKPAGAKKSDFVHTLNGSGLAVGRTYLAILENYQQADGSILIPPALRPYMGGETVITQQPLGRPATQKAPATSDSKERAL